MGGAILSRNCRYYSALHKGPRIPPLSDNLKRIYRILSQKIMSWGYNIYVSDSVRTRSRYLIVTTRQGLLKIRLSDHYPKRSSDIDYDVYTGQPRKKALEYRELIAILEKRFGIKKNKPQTEIKKVETSESEAAGNG